MNIGIGWDRVYERLKRAEIIVRSTRARGETLAQADPHKALELAIEEALLAISRLGDLFDEPGGNDE